MIVESSSRLTTSEKDGFCLQGFKMWMMGTRQIQSTAWLDLLIALQKISETNCNISSRFFIAHIRRSLTPLENYHNIQYPLKN